MKQFISIYTFATFLLSSSVVLATQDMPYLLEAYEKKGDWPLLKRAHGYIDCGRLLTAVNDRKRKSDGLYVFQYDSWRYFEITKKDLDSLGQAYTYKAELNHQLLTSDPDKYSYAFGDFWNLEGNQDCVDFRLKPISKVEFEQYTQVESLRKPLDHLGRPVPNWVCPMLKLRCDPIEQIPGTELKGVKCDSSQYKNLVTVCTIKQFMDKFKDENQLAIDSLTTTLHEMSNAYKTISAYTPKGEDGKRTTSVSLFLFPDKRRMEALASFLKPDVCLGYLDDYSVPTRLVTVFWLLKQIQPIEEQPIPMDIVTTCMWFSVSIQPIDYYLLLGGYAIVNPAGVPYSFSTKKIQEVDLWNTSKLVPFVSPIIYDLLKAPEAKLNQLMVKKIKRGEDFKYQYWDGKFLMSLTSYDTLHRVRRKVHSLSRKETTDSNFSNDFKVMICARDSECFFEYENQIMKDDKGIPYVFEKEIVSEYQ